MDATVLNYGGGRQTVAICLLIAKGILPKPDRIVMADTGRENPTTFEYLDKYVQPLLREHGMQVEIAPRSLAKVDLHSHKGDLLIPAFTKTGKLSAFCSGEWKRDVVEHP
jgi:3'-phosphoadenosine 5'-phosphosulfate sulfotransferase (PAPS reductase)/FAD synthetase